jgi:transcription termination factor Rho
VLADRRIILPRSTIPVNIAELKRKSIPELHDYADSLALPPHDVLGPADADLPHRTEAARPIRNTRRRRRARSAAEGYGFLRSQDWNYLYSPDDIYVSPSQIKRFDLRTGDTVSGQVRPPRSGSVSRAAQGREGQWRLSLTAAKARIDFDNLRHAIPTVAFASRPPRAI